MNDLTIQQIVEAVLDAILELPQMKWIEGKMQMDVPKAYALRDADSTAIGHPKRAKLPPTTNRTPGGKSSHVDHVPPDVAKFRALSGNDPILQAVQLKMIRDRQNELRAQKQYPTYDELLRWVRENWDRLVRQYLEEFRIVSLEGQVESEKRMYAADRRNRVPAADGRHAKIMRIFKARSLAGRHATYDECGAAVDAGILV